ncbi:MAG: thrombospondin type 3 repeat-containing protein, partial [Gemmatimonadota bacterium]|nr:thrombospondin type 3 repeat-containing protein [Gemmatimonadota bacterium]
MRRSLLLVFAGVLFVSAPRAFAQDAGASIRDTTVLDLLNRGKPPVRAATSRVVGQPLGSLSLVEIMNQGKPSTSYWPNIGAPKERGKAAFWLFGGPTASDFPQLESVACDQLAIVSCSVDRFSFGPRAGVLWWPWWRRPFGFGVSGGKSSVSVTQQWEEVPFPETVVTELDVYTATAFFDAWHSFNRQTRIIGTVGLVWAWNRARITEFFPGDTIVTHRNDDGGRWTIGASLERDITRDTRIRFEYRFIDGEAGDADRQHQFGILFGWAPGGHVPTREPAPPPITRYAEPPPIGPDGREPRPISRPPIIFPVGDPEVGGPPDDGTLPPPPTDSDDDGVPDDVDQCPRTPPGRTVDERGCEPGEPPPPTSADSDDDGVPDDVDRCPRTPPGRTVDERGCEPGEPPPPTSADSDDDGVPDDVDRCPSTPPGRTVDERGCEPGEPPPPPSTDSDDDGVPDDV